LTTVAGIDVGTSSTRLLVLEDGRARERLLRITRLGEGVDATGGLAVGAIERTLDCLRDYRERMDAHGVEQMRITATSATRDAENREDFFGPAEAIVGARPELLSGNEEAQLTFAGVASELDPADGPFLVMDIGEGSTAFVVGTDTAEAARSVDIGCVRLTEKFLHHDPPLPEELSAALSLVEAYLEDVAREVPVERAVHLVGLADTVTTVAAVELGLAAYDRDRVHHAVLSHDAVEDVFRTLATEPRAQRVANPGLEEARADVIVGGCCVLVKVMRQYGFGELLVSEADILDGLALSIA
jgi:exopolyphosphatase / guanosine-5'-triphosphate,3'-diphosphate pyrophosphatase